MDLKNAINILVETYPGYVPTGYWEKEEGYIFNTQAIGSLKKQTAPGQFVVTSSGDVYGTNPLRSRLNIEDMKSL